MQWQSFIRLILYQHNFQPHQSANIGGKLSIFVCYLIYLSIYLQYREVAVLIDELNSSAMVKTRAARTIAHECSHFWFGNLCTMDWWTNLWLNEG